MLKASLLAVLLIFSNLRSSNIVFHLNILALLWSFREASSSSPMMFLCFHEVLLLLIISHCVLCTTDYSAALHKLGGMVYGRHWWSSLSCVDSCAVFQLHFLLVLLLVSKQHFVIHAVHERCLKFVMCSLLTMRMGTQERTA